MTYFGGYTLTIDHPDEGWSEEKPIPRCPEAKVLEAVGAAVKGRDRLADERPRFGLG